MDRPITRRHFLGAALGTAGLAGLGPAALAACGSTGAQANPGSASASAAVTIDYWHVNSAALGGSTVKDLVGRFHQQNPRITVQERFQPGLYDGLLKNLQAAIAAGRPPDLAQVGYPYLDYVATNLPVTPVHSLAQRYGDGSFFSQFENSALNAGRVRGKQVAMPYAISSMVAYYNADLLRRSGVDPDHPPTTWDGWRQAAGAVRKVTGKPSLYIGVSSGDTWAMQTLIESNGAQLLSCRQGKPHAGLGGAQAVQAIQFWADMVRDGLALNALRDQGQQAFLNGSLAACFEAISARQGFEKQAPFTLRAAPCPSFGARPRRLAAGGNVLFVFARDEARRRAAWELIKFLESPAALTAWTKGTGYLPPRRGVTDDPRYLGQFLQQNPIEGVAAKEVSLIVPWESFPGANGLDAQNVLFTSVQQAIGGQVPAAQALRDADSKVNELIGGASCA